MVKLPFFGKSPLPPTAIIQLGRWGWHTMWEIMVSQLAPGDDQGAYERPESQFRHWITAPEEASADAPQYPGMANRYVLVVGVGCPWAHRTLVVRALKGLESAIAVETVVADPNVGGWRFQTPYLGCQTLRDLYELATPGYSGRCTVPTLWDTQTQTVVNNESSEIIVMLNAAFNAVASQPERDLYPPELKATVDTWNDRIYTAVNNGVYRCGFARTQTAYDAACTELFTTLDDLDRQLSTQRYLCGEQLTLADVRLYTTLIRFDLVYYSLFQCNLRRIQDYPHLGAYLRDLYQHPGIAATSDLVAIKREYYGSLFPLNPGERIPIGPDLSYLQAPAERG